MTRDSASIADAPLDQLGNEEWERLCDGCARCCLHKLQDEETGEVYYTDIACPLLDLERCRCTDYPHRAERMPECVQLTPEEVRGITWLPATCAYRLRALDRPLPPWHHLMSGNPEDVHHCGASIRGKAIHVNHPDEDTLKSRVVEMIHTTTGVRLYFTPDQETGDD